MVFKQLFSNYLTVNRNVIDFCILTLHPMTLNSDFRPTSFSVHWFWYLWIKTILLLPFYSLIPLCSGNLLCKISIFAVSWDLFYGLAHDHVGGCSRNTLKMGFHGLWHPLFLMKNHFADEMPSYTIVPQYVTFSSDCFQYSLFIFLFGSWTMKCLVVIFLYLSCLEFVDLLQYVSRLFPPNLRKFQLFFLQLFLGLICFLFSFWD